MDISALLAQSAPTTIQQAQGQQLQQQGMQQNQAIQQAMLPGQLQAQGLAAQQAQQDLASKRRSLAVSMLNGIATEQDPAKQASLYQTLKPMAERYDPTLQLPDDYDPSTVKSLMMSQIPVGSLPEYQMMQQNMGLMQALKSRLAPDPNATAGQDGGMPSVQPDQGALQPPQSNQPGVMPIPPGSSPLNANDMALMALVKPGVADAMTKQGDLAVKQGELALKQNPAPQKEAEKAAENASEAGKTLNIMNANLPVVLNRFKEMSDAAKDASYGFGVNNEGDGPKQQFHDQFDSKFAPLGLQLPEARANTILEQRAAQGILPELGPQLAQAGVKGNKFLETIATSASGLKLSADPQAKQDAINGLQEQYINNLKSTARQVRAYGGQAPTDEEIDAKVAEYQKDPPQSPPAASQQARSQLKSQPATLNSPEAIGQAFKAGQLTRAQAKALLASHGFQ